MVDRTMPALLRSLKNRVTALERRLARGSYQLPPRLQQTGEQVADWNDAVQVGFYSATAAAANAPEARALVGQVFYDVAAGVIAQEVFSPSTNGPLRNITWRRVYSGGAWSAWSKSPDVLFSERTSGNIGGITTAWVQVTPISVPLTLTRPSNVRLSLMLFTYSSVVSDVVAIAVRDGATELQSWTNQANSSPTTAGTGQATFLECIMPLAAGSHTFTLWVTRAAGSGTVTVASAPVNHCWLSAEVVG